MSKNYSLANLKKENVLSAINEFEILGEEYFLKNYGFGKSRSYFLLYNKKFYPSKAIAGVAHKYFNGLVMGKKYGRDFSGGDKTVKNCLSNLGYSVTSPKDLKTNENLIIT